MMDRFTPTLSILTFLGISAVTQNQMQPIQVIKQSPYADIKKEPKRYDQPDQAAAWLANMRKTHKGNNPSQLNQQIQSQLNSNKSRRQIGQNLPGLQFEELGPGIFGGRIRGFVIHPEKPGHLLAGAVFGGVWKSTNDGQFWEAKTDFLTNIAVGSMITDPDNPERVYIGTGEGYFNFDAAQGAGIFVSEDFGETWNQLQSTDNEKFYFVNRMVRIPNSQTLFAATRTGLYESNDLGQSWDEVSNHTVSGRGFTDLQLNPNDTNHLLAAHYGDPNDEVRITINSPESLTDSTVAVPAGFGPAFSTTAITATLTLANDNTSNTMDGCEPIADVSGQIALIQRGNCRFDAKVKNAQDAGAVAVIIYQNADEPPFIMGGDDDGINIPVAMITQTFGDQLADSEEIINATAANQLTNPLNRFVMQSLDQGQSWHILEAADGMPDRDVSRIEIAFAQTGQSYLAVSKNGEDDNGNPVVDTMGMWRSIGPDHTSFEKAPTDSQFIERQGWYDLAITVNPNDPNHVIAGAVNQFTSTNGGLSMTRSSLSFPFSSQPVPLIQDYIHADHHGYIFSPHNPDHLYVVSDGGVSKSEDGGETYISLNNGLNISQSYAIAVSPNGDRVTSGTQDNGSQIYLGDQQSWLEWFGADGGYGGWDQQQDRFVYGSYQNGNLFGSSNGGISASIMPLPDTDGTSFITPVLLDENDGNRMLVGTDNVFYTTNARSIDNATWTDVSGTINGGSISALAFNPHDPSEAYAGMSSSSSTTPQIVKISGLGTSNTVTDVSPSVSQATFDSVVTDIKVDTHDTSGQTVYITLSDYENRRIWRSTNGGSTWQPINNNLPNIPLYQVINDPIDSEILYVGSELGLWVGRSANGGPYHWEQYDYGPAHSRVIDLAWHEDKSLFIATHGRGTFKATRNPIDLSVIKFVATNSSCDVDNIIDRGESGEYIIQVKNNSNKDIGAVNLSFDNANMISFINANQQINLGPFESRSIALMAELNTQASCQTEENIPVTVSSSEGTFSQELSVITTANRTTESGAYSDGAENADTQLSNQLLLGSDAWLRDPDKARSGTHSWFTNNENSYSDKSLVSPWLTLDGGGNVLSFSLSYNTEGDSIQRRDGVILEMRVKDQDSWFDIGHLSTVPYDGQLNINNTAQGLFAWSGTRLDWRDAEVNLGTTYVGEQIQFRFRMVSDTNSALEGFWIDDINLTNTINDNTLACDECVSTDNVVPNKGLWYDPAHDGHGFIIEAVGINGLFYTLFYTYDDAGDPEWFNSLTTLAGGQLNASFEPGTLDKFRYNYSVNPAETDPVFKDPAFTDGRFSVNFNTDEIRNHPACQDGTSRNLNAAALAKWQINGTVEEWCIEPLISNADRPEPDFGTAWWAGSQDNGWGYSLAQTGDLIIAFLFYYDAEGNSRWATGLTNGFMPETNISLTLQDVQGYGRTSPMVDRVFIDSGTLTLNLNNTFRDLDTDGVNHVDITYQGTEGGRWLRRNEPIMTLLREH